MAKIKPEIFKEYDIRGKYPKELDQKTAYLLGRAFVLSLKAKTIAVGLDRRPESALILPAFLKGVKDAGGRIFDLGINSTPAIFLAIFIKKLDGGVSLTASHNPVGYAGLKLADKNGSLLGLNTGLKKIWQLAEKITPPKIKKFPPVPTAKIDIAQAYYQLAAKIVDLKTIRGFKIVLDASNGSGARLADYFFVRLHSKIIKMNFKAGDRFPDHNLNPLMAITQKPAKEAVKKQAGDLGVIFDGDGDRCLFIDEIGNLVNPYYLNCLLAELILKKYPRINIVIDARLQLGLKEVINHAGGRPLVSRAGYANIVKLMQEKKAFFGCENSGHYFFNFRLIDKKKNYVFGDAIMPILLILEYLKENNLSLSSAVAKFKKKYLISGEINYQKNNLVGLEKKLIKKYSQQKTNRLDGLSIYDPNWFINIRSSKTEPLIRLNIEAKNKKTLNKIKKEAVALIK